MKGANYLLKTRLNSHKLSFWTPLRMGSPVWLDLQDSVTWNGDIFIEIFQVYAESMEPFGKTSENQWWNHVGYHDPNKISSPAEVSMKLQEVGSRPIQNPHARLVPHSSSKLSGKNAMEGMGQFHWHLLPVAGAIWFYKTMQWWKSGA